MPYVHLARPGRVQSCPKSAACWSPRIPAMGTLAPKTPASVSAIRPPLETISGRTRCGMDRSRHSSASQVPVRRSMSIVRDALLTSVTCCRPPVSFQTSQESTVPAASRPAAAFFRAPGTWSRSQRSLDPEKYGSRTRPVFRRMTRSWPATRSRCIAAAVRRSCQTIARCTGRPVSRSQRTTVSRWFVIPIAATSPGRRPAAFNASRADASVVSQISPASCSTQPGCGKCCAISFCAAPSFRPRSSNTIARELLVPWSRARTWGTAGILGDDTGGRAQPRPSDAGRRANANGRPEGRPRVACEDRRYQFARNSRELA